MGPLNNADFRLGGPAGGLVDGLGALPFGPSFQLIRLPPWRPAYIAAAFLDIGNVVGAGPGGSGPAATGF
jgi:hypothetical protein